MDAKERLIRFKDLLRILGREHSLESSDYRTAVLQESWTLLELLGTIEGFISDERLGIAGEDQRKLDAAKGVLRSWMSTAKGTLTPQQAQQFSRNVTMIIARTTQSLDQMLTAVDAERKDTGRTSAYTAKSVPWYQNVMRVAVLSIAPLIAGCVPGQKAGAEEPVVTNPQKERDYVKEFKESLKSVKLVDGKTAGWYNEQGFQALKERRMTDAAKNLYKVIDMMPEAGSPIMTLANLYSILADESADNRLKQAYLRESLSLYDRAAMKLRNNKTMDEDEKLDLLSAAYESLALVSVKLGMNDDAKNYFVQAAKMRPLSPASKKVAQQLGIP